MSNFSDFYIKNYQAVIGKDKIDLTSDPPPDLAIEIDITNRTRSDNYLLLKVPELWRYTRKGLQIYLLQSDCYLARLGRLRRSPHGVTTRWNVRQGKPYMVAIAKKNLVTLTWLVTR